MSTPSTRRGTSAVPAREVYRITIHPGPNTMQATARLAKVIIDRWLPGHAGGAVILSGPQLCQLLHPIFVRAERLRCEVTLQVDTSSGRPVITELGSPHHARGDAT